MPSKPYKGFVRDFHPQDVPDGTYTFANNAVVGSLNGDLYTLSNEEAVSLCVKFDDGREVVDKLYITPNKLVIFSSDGVNNHEIGLLEECTYTTLFNNSCLGFSKYRSISAKYRLRNNCIESVYFADGNNELRVIDIASPPTTCDELQLLQDFTFPVVNADVVEGLGILDTGAYRIAIQYNDGEGNYSDILNTSAPLRVYPSPSFSYPEIVLENLEKTNKGIIVSTSQVDTRYTSYNIIVVTYTGQTGNVSRIYRSPNISTNVATYVVDGSFSGFEEISQADVQLTRPDFTASLLEIWDNRLIALDIKEAQRDYCTYQSFVNNITAKAVIKKINPLKLEDGNPKNPTNTSYSFMGDEIYACGVQFIYKNGSLSKIFHIPGRSKLPVDEQLLTVVAGVATNETLVTQADVAHLGLVAGDTVERWKVYNDGWSTASGLAYYEGTNLYPTTENCDGEKVYGDLAGTPIRHHRMPDRSSIPLVDENGMLQAIGLEFDNIVYPDTDIVGHFIHVGIRDEANKTVTDTAILFHTFFKDNGEVGTYNISYGGEGDNVGDFDGKTTAVVIPTRLFKNRIPSFNYVKFNNRLQRFGDHKFFRYDVNVREGRREEFRAGFWFVRYDKDIINVEGNAIVEDTAFPTYNELAPFGSVYVKNRSLTLEGNVYKWNQTLPFNAQEGSALYVSLKLNRKVFDDLEGIQYARVHSVPFFDREKSTVYGQDTYISPLSFHNVTALDNNDNRRSIANGSLLSHMYMESPVNMAMRLYTQDKTLCGGYFKMGARYVDREYLLTEDDTFLGEEYLKYEVITAPDDDSNDPNQRSEPCKNYFAVNDDFNVITDVQTYTAFPYSTFNCCTNCSGVFRNQIFPSAPAYQEEIADFFKSFSPLDSTTLEGSKGRITAAKVYDDNLWVWTEDAVFVYAKNYQERSSQEGLVSIVSTGSLFDIPPRRLMESDIGVGGCLNRNSVISTEHGLFWWDGLGSKPYLNGKELNEGNVNWFKEVFTSGFYSDMRRKGIDLPDHYRFGAQAIYDDRYERILLTNKDYTLRTAVDVIQRTTFFDSDLFDTTLYGKLLYETTSNKFYDIVPGRRLREIPVGSEDYFLCNKTITMSYSFMNKTWVGTHEYVPHVFMSTKNDLYYTLGNEIYKANTAGVYRPITFEYVIKAPTTSIIEYVEFLTYAFKDNKELVDITFEKAQVYNSRYYTGELTLQTRASQAGRNFFQNRLQPANNVITLERNHYNWRFNFIRNKITDVNSSFLNEYCVDYTKTDKNFIEPTFSARNQWQDENIMDGQYYIVRLTFSKPDVKLIVQYFKESLDQKID